MIKLLGIAGVALVLTLGWLLTRDPGYIPHFDAARIELVDTAAEAECAAQEFVNTRMAGHPDNEAMETCAAASKLSQDVDLSVVQPQWCQSFVAMGVWNGTPDECVDILRGQQMWPNMRGRLSDQWVRQFPYPGNLLDTAMSTVRNVVRGETDREELTDARS